MNNKREMFECENETKMMLYLREMRQTNENIQRTEAKLTAAAHNQTKPVLHVAASLRQSRRPETTPDPKDDEEDKD